MTAERSNIYRKFMNVIYDTVGVAHKFYISKPEFGKECEIIDKAITLKKCYF